MDLLIQELLRTIDTCGVESISGGDKYSGELKGLSKDAHKSITMGNFYHTVYREADSTRHKISLVNL